MQVALVQIHWERITMRQKPYRVQHKFWLDITKNQEDQLDHEIHELKKTRRFASTIRDAIRLILDLRQGRLDVLVELFPWVRVEFLDGIHQEKTAGERAIEAHLKRLEELMVEQGSSSIGIASVKPQNGNEGGPIKMDVPQLDMPVFDDDDDFSLEIQRDTSTDASRNFVNTMLSLQQ